ncbi:MAG: DUF4292 domain-containing protein [Acidobacteria bacterium]|nr:DUF4292 domain-containing protein [Acidobacteriota bacterium]
MPPSRLSLTVLAVASILFSSSGCSPARRSQAVRVPALQDPRPALTATRTELIEKAGQASKAIRTLKLKVSYRLTGRNPETGETKEWRESDGFILLKKPGDIRVRVQVFQVTAIDMVSNGTEFSIDVPRKNTFIRGLNHQVILPRKDVPVNVRPQHIFEALALEALEDADPSLITLEEDQREGRKFYILSCNRWASDGSLALKRKIWFDRVDLNIVRLQAYAPEGRLESEIHYSDFRSVDGQVYPALVRFERPQEAYRMAIRAQKIEINPNLAAAAFVLKKSPVRQVVDLTRDPLPEAAN